MQLKEIIRHQLTRSVNSCFPNAKSSRMTWYLIEGRDCNVMALTIHTENEKRSRQMARSIKSHIIGAQLGGVQVLLVKGRSRSRLSWRQASLPPAWAQICARKPTFQKGAKARSFDCESAIEAFFFLPAMPSFS